MDNLARAKSMELSCCSRMALSVLASAKFEESNTVAGLTASPWATEIMQKQHSTKQTQMTEWTWFIQKPNVPLDRHVGHDGIKEKILPI
jgi:hypothetical protein